MSKNHHNVQFLSPLVKSGKIQGLNEQTARPFLQDIAKPFYRDSPVYQQLASFIGNQLAIQPNFQRVNLHNDSGAGEYDPDNQTLDIHSNAFPVRTFIHEGTHALDNRENQQKRSYQNEAINFLAKRLGNTQIINDKGDWYEKARRMLNNSTFNTPKYNFGKFKVDQNNVKNGIPYGKDFSGGILQEGQELLGYPKSDLSYSDIQNKLNEIKSEVPPRPFYSFSEFPAFAVESLNNKWKIKPQNTDFYNKKDILESDDKQHGENLGRKFLKKMLKATYRNFQDLHNQQQQMLPENQRTTFAEAYYDADKTFLKKLSQLRNYAEYPNTEEGESNFTTKMRETSVPSYQPSVSSSGSFPNFISNPLVQFIQPSTNSKESKSPLLLQNLETTSSSINTGQKRKREMVNPILKLTAPRQNEEETKEEEHYNLRKRRN